VTEVGADRSDGWARARAAGAVGLGLLVGAVAAVAGLALAARWITTDGLGPVPLLGIVVGAGGVALLVRSAASGRRRLRRRGRVIAVPLGVIGLLVVVIVVAPAVIASFVPPTSLGSATPADLGLGYEDVVFATPDGVELSGWYLPSTNGAAVMLRHGSGSTRSGVLDQAAVLAANGYGVLLADARGHGRSGGRGNDVGWWGDLDTEAGVTFLAGRADVDPARIGVVGMSMGGEEAIGAAAADPRIRVVVAEGATVRSDADTDWYSEEFGLPGVLQEGLDRLRFALVDLLSPAPRPTGLRDAVVGATTTRFLVVAAGDVADEMRVAERLAAAAPERVDTWVVAGSGHTGGLRAEPEEWERRVVSTLDEVLLGR